MRFSGMTRWYRTPAPTLGQDTATVLQELLGLDDAEIAHLRAEGIIGEWPAGL
jgi:crotonobetainyl-CoA:carnitine CoA-transferase CaiB-like acyl-CoA transferase